MSKLNCSIGDLAITVKANLPANLGNIVRIIGSQGLQEWEGQDELLYTRNIQILGKDRYLYYIYQQEHDLNCTYVGQMPKRFIKRIYTEGAQGLLDRSEIPAKVRNSNAST